MRTDSPDIEHAEELLNDPHVAAIERCMRREWPVDALADPTCPTRMRNHLALLVAHWYRRSAPQVPPGCSRWDIGRAVLERRVHIELGLIAQD